MAQPSPVVTVNGELRRILARDFTNRQTGETRTAYIASVLTDVDGDLDDDFEGGGFVEVWIAPDLIPSLPSGLEPGAKVRGVDVSLLCRAYAQSRNFGSSENPRMGAVLGLSYISGSWGSPDAGSVSALGANYVQPSESVPA